MKRALPWLLLLLLAAAAATAAAAAAAASQQGVQTPKPQSCPAFAWLQQELSYLQGPLSAAVDEPAAAAAAAADTATAAADTKAAAADTAAAADPNASGAYVELTEEALNLALEKRPTALVLLGDSRCTDTSDVFATFFGVARAFSRLSQLQPRVLFAKVLRKAEGSGQRRGMRYGDKNSCEMYLRYEQHLPAAAAATAGEPAAAAAAGEPAAAAAAGEPAAAAATEQPEGEYMTLFLPENSTEEEIKLQIIKLAYPTSLRAPNKTFLDEFLFEFPQMLIRFFEKPADITPVPSAVSVASTRLPIVDVYDPALAAAFNVEPPRQLLLKPKGFRKEFTLSEDREEQRRLIEALEEETPAVVSLTSLTAASIFTELRPVVFLFGGSEPAISEDFAFAEAAAAFDKSVLFCSAVIPSSLQLRAMSYLGIEETAKPQVIIVRAIDDPKKLMKFVCGNAESKKTILECLTKFKEGKLKPYYKSAKPPKVQKGPVYELVASRFKSVVLESNKDVLLLIYSSSCPHSAIFMPVFEEVPKP
ncbi:thioredoxin domain-containing protein, putative [Eimeria tenella]|uniref:Thioredoxin domain-containing protein, putative n=1 Tax=Eimeria tenella TaxID=5802 RepID=U6L6R7_EIMTE|nr:thioredoxin domain-containing protein, putative [Eimeria tenella]CDJ44284.1 thioredoxin domain-containing protein, putative [Eimeria tenella]|eukprot:XP_013235033.1 thioredoxin domain-containing protein, putative [Eimeria tenella]